MNTENAPKVTETMQKSVAIPKLEFMLLPELSLPELVDEVLAGDFELVVVDFGVDVVPV